MTDETAFDLETTAVLGLVLVYLELIATEAPEHEVAACLQELTPLLDAIPGPKGDELRERFRQVEVGALQALVDGPSPTAAELLARMEAAFAADAPREVIQDLRQAIRERKGDGYAPEMDRANEIMREMNKRRGIS